MKEDPESEAHRWYLQAEQDLKDAEYLMDGERYNLACLLSQLSAEKALKSFLYNRSGAESIRGHSVAILCRDAEKFDPSFSEWLAKISPLDKFYLPLDTPILSPEASLPPSSAGKRQKHPSQ
jgi:HEPN domain-containing protein